MSYIATTQRGEDFLQVLEKCRPDFDQISLWEQQNTEDVILQTGNANPH
jgi:hypothetical protein